MTIGQMFVSLHDEPPKGGNFEKVEITVSSVEISRADGSWQTISKGMAVFDLLTLKDGAEAVLAQANLPIGTYEQIRLHLGDDPRVMVDGQWEPLRIPSGFQTGLKLNGPFEIRPRQMTRLILDMDPSQNIHWVPGQNEWYLKPAIEIEAFYIGIEGSDGAFQPTASVANISAAAGGVVAVGDGASIDIPPGALAADTQVTIEKAVSGYPAYLLSPEGLILAKPATLKLPYAELEIPGGRGPQDIALFLDAEQIPVIVDEAAGTVSGQITHFSIPYLTLKGTVYITFDDGPMPEGLSGDIEEFIENVTLQRESQSPRDEGVLSDLLDALSDAGTKAAFFQVGKLIEHSPDLTARLLLAGHRIGNHTYEHATFEFADHTQEEIYDELLKTNNIINDSVVKAIRHLVDAGQWEATPPGTRLYLLRLFARGGAPIFRPPGGKVVCAGKGKWCGFKNSLNKDEDFYGTPMGKAVDGLNMGVFFWDVDPEDWKLDKGLKPASDLVSVIKNADIGEYGDIILMHERRITADAWSEIAQNLADRGLIPVTFDSFHPSDPNPSDWSLSAAQKVLASTEPQPGGAIVVDDLSAGSFQRFSDAPEHDGYWLSANIGYPSWDPHMYYTWNNGPDRNGGTATSVVENSAKWSPSVAAGFYRIEAFIPRNHAYTHDAQYAVGHRDGDETCRIDQSAYFDEWVDLGTYPLNADSFVSLTDLTGETDTTTQIGFDAVRFTPTGDVEKKAGAGCL